VIKKGFTLIELVIVIALVFLMVGVVDSIFMSYVKGYKNSVLENKGFNYLGEATAIIEKEVNFQASDVKTSGNIITINYYKGNSPKYIKYVNGEVSIVSNVDSKNVSNTIIDNVKDFVAIKSGKTIYIKIIWKNGQCIERCIAIENAN